ncbi:MAG: hypothetical protein ACFFEU_11325, partial [Candidatus Thorarchaeota archaeon]
MNKRLLRIQLLSLAFVTLMLVGYIPQAVWAGQMIDREKEIFPKPFEGYDLDPIYIFYDPNDEILSAVAEAVYEILAFRLNYVELIPASSYTIVEARLNDAPWIAIYVLNTDLGHVVFEDRNMEWRQFYQLLNEYWSTQHVVGTGNTFSLAPKLSSLDKNIHHSNVEQVDGLLLILYDIWAVADIVEQRAHVNSAYENAGKDIRSMAVKLYGDNMETLVRRTLEPVDLVGEEDKFSLAERTADMWERHAPTIRPAAYEMQDDGTLAEVPLDDLPEDFSPAIRLCSPAEVTSSDFSLGEIPLFSALNGPIGDIIDILLEVLAGEGQTEITIPTNIIESIQSAFEVIEPIVGIVSDFDMDSPLKSVVEALASEFPFIEEFKDYLNIMLKALFNLRGDISDILEIVWDLVVALLPDIIPEEVTDFLFDILGVNDGLWDMVSEVVSEGKGVFDAIFGFFTNRALKGVMNKTLAATLGLSGTEINTLLPRMVNFVTATVTFLTSGDYVKFITELGDDLFSSIFSTTGLETAISNLMAVIEMALTAVELVDTYEASTMMQLVIDMLNQFIPSGLTQSADSFAQSLLTVVKTYSEGALSDVNAFKSELLTIVDGAVSGVVTTNQKNLIVDIITLIAGFHNEGFNKNQLPDILEIAHGVINEFGYAHGGYASLAQMQDLGEAIDELVGPVLGIIAMVSDSDALKNFVGKTVSDFQSELGSIPDMVMKAIDFMDTSNVFSSYQDELEMLSEIAAGVINLIKEAKGQSFQGIMQGLLMSAGMLLGTIPDFDDVPLDPVLKLLQQFFPKAFGLDPQTMPSPQETVNQIFNIIEPLMHSIFDSNTLRELLTFFMEVKDIFTGGVKWLVGKLFDWLGGLLNPVFDDLENTIEELFAGITDLLGYSTTLPIGLGDWSLFDLSIALGIRVEFDIDLSPLFDLIASLIFDARSTFSIDDVGDFFQVIFSFFEITPQFYAELGVGGFDSSKNAIMGTLLSLLGLDLAFEGSAKFVLNLFTFKNGMFAFEDFMKVVEWGLHIKITLSKEFTLIDIFTAGLGGGALAAIMEFLGLDMIKIIFMLAVELDIVKKAASATAPEVSTLTLAITFGITVHIPLDLIIVAIIIDLSMEIILTFFQDFASSAPMKITLRLLFTVEVTFRFLFFEEGDSWTWEPGGPWDLSPSKGTTEYNESGVGFDTDNDGLSDEYEKEIPGLDWQKVDTDGDGADDKLEVQTIGSDPVIPDTDFDGLLDGEEWELGTSLFWPDTDWDDLTDYEEVKIYGTDPFTQDTDGDHLTDAYEVYTRWNLTQTPTVE